jgi:hypothetical protein
MYCPSCRTEYRPGFTVCADCNVPLVPELPDEDSPEAINGREGVSLVWSGDDDRHRAEACSALERAGITPHPVSREDHLIAPSEHPRFEVYVSAEAAAEAKAVLDAKVLSAEEWDQLEASGALELPDEDAAEPIMARRTGRNWDPEEATEEVWSGEDVDLARMIATSLRENGIDCRIEENSADAESTQGQLVLRKLFVLPDDGQRGKEIVREILEASPL